MQLKFFCDIIKAMQTLLKTYTGAQILLKTLQTLGTDTIFGYPGGIVLGVYDELAKQNDIKHYLMRHEQSAIHAAEGYARVSGKCGVVIVTSGPGATNIVTGLANAYLDGFPLVAITGQVSAELLHKDAFQEVDIVDMTKSCTKANFQVKNIADLQSTIEKAFQIAQSGKKGPVLIDITKNVFSETTEFVEQQFIRTLNTRYKGSVKDAFALISQAKKPLIVVGGGAIDASSEVLKFAKLNNIPVVSTMMGLGNFPSNDDNYLGMIGIFGSANVAIKECDLIFAIGARFNDRISGCFKDDELSKTLIHLDINEKEISKVIPASVALIGDAKEILSEMLAFPQLNFSDWVNEIKPICVYNYQKRTNQMHSFEVMQKIQEAIEKFNPIVTTEVGQHQVWASRCLKFNSPRKFITSGGLGTMGFGFPSAIGASVANSLAPVVCIAGDGSLQMNIQELATCVDYNLPIKVFIMNNGYLGMVRQFQEKVCEQRYFATKISNPDFVKLAESYGAKGIRVTKLDDIKLAIKEAFETNGPIFVDFVIEPMELL